MATGASHTFLSHSLPCGKQLHSKKQLKSRTYVCYHSKVQRRKHNSRIFSKKMNLFKALGV